MDEATNEMAKTWCHSWFLVRLQGGEEACDIQSFAVTMMRSNFHRKILDRDNFLDRIIFDDQ